MVIEAGRTTPVSSALENELTQSLMILLVSAESTFYPGMQYIVGSWYRKDELAKRSCLFRKDSPAA